MPAETGMSAACLGICRGSENSLAITPCLQYTSPKLWGKVGSLPTQWNGGALMTGKYRHGLDGKGRLSIPARFREELGETFYITIGLGHSLMVLPQDGWDAIVEKKKSLSMAEAQKLRFFFANALRCQPDKQGRVLLPQELRDYARLRENAVILGFGDKAEIWDAETYDEMEKAFLEEGSLDSVLTSLEL